MAKNRTDLFLVVLCFVLSLAGIANAAPLHVKHFTEAMATAKSSSRPVAVYVHGSSWHAASRIFREKIWRNTDFPSQLKHDVILTEIEIFQNLDEKKSKEEAATHQGWNGKTVRSYPAVQVYAEDGFLLKTLQGREMRIITSTASLAASVDAILESASQRRELISQLKVAHEKGDATAETALLIRLIELPINRDPALLKQLQTSDPTDASGWQAKLSFKDWGFIREVTRLIDQRKPDEALAETEKLLESPRFDPGQRALVFGARGMALVAKGDLSAAWEAFEKAKAVDPDGANGKSVWHYGIRVAGIPLRIALPPESALAGKELGDNISRDHASYTVSSSNDSDTTPHDSLFAGPPSPTGYAFHTQQEKRPHIVIDLTSSCEIRALRIRNRSSQPQRAASLALWNSEDGTTWTKAWNASRAESAWDIDFETPIHARYLKLGLDQDAPEFLHLQTVDIYGHRH